MNACGLILMAATVTAAAERLNVLFVAVDDLRPQLGCYGDPIVRSPNLDRLAQRGRRFERAYCQQALCSPSRISLLSGRRTWTTRIYSIGPALRETMPEVVTLPQHFRRHGYLARSLGKVYHVGIDDPESWSEPPWQSKAPRYGPQSMAKVRARAEALRATGEVLPPASPKAPIFAGPVFEAPDVPDEALTDGDIAREAVATLRDLARDPSRPFFLAVGFHNPHVPWVAPRRYFDLYDPAAMPLPTNRAPPAGAPPFAARSGRDFYWYAGVPERVDDEFGRRCLQAYCAAISYVDACIGRLLDEIDRLGLRERTVVVVWGDHGYYMGEHGWWGSKHNNYEGATRAPLLIAAPGLGQPGRPTRAIVEFVDIYPTLVELCGLPPVEGLEGRSLLPLLRDPDAPWEGIAISEYPRDGYLGTAMRTDRWRYVEWRDRTGALVARELYDYQTDPDETRNHAEEPALREVIETLSARLASMRPAGRSPSAGTTAPALIRR